LQKTRGYVKPSRQKPDRHGGQNASEHFTINGPLSILARAHAQLLTVTH